MSKCIVSQIHIPDLDIQGNLTADDKKEITDVSIQHLRKYNPDAYIIFSGHGHRPYSSTLDLCDAVYWENKCRPMNQYGFVEGMPAQFYFVSVALKHAKEKGFKYVVKTRTDSIIGLPDIVTESHKIIEEENKRLLLTQQTENANHIIGDCFMYGETKIIDAMWDMKHPVVNPYWGREHVGMYFAKYFGDEYYLDNAKWRELLHMVCAFRNVTWLKYLDMRWNFVDTFKPRWDYFKGAILDNAFDFNEYYWGKKCGWHCFNGDVDLCNVRGPKYSEASFYDRF